MYPKREVFSEAPLALVVAEIRFTDSARLRQQQTRDELVIALEGLFPYAIPGQEEVFSLTPRPTSDVQDFVVLANAERTETLTLKSEALIYETTAYGEFADLVQAVATACDALVAASVRPALRRIGLRYIDEVRVPEEISDARQWSRWIDQRLIGQLEVGPEGFPVTIMNSVSNYDLGSGRGLTVRCAALNQGPVVVPHHLERRSFEPGPFFVLDFDGFQDFTALGTIALDSKVVSEALHEVHAPCGAAFQQSITDDARELFRGAQQS